jgi:hypothetical protein
MNTELTKQIVKHVYTNLGIISSSSSYSSKYYSLFDDKFLLPDTIYLTDDKGNIQIENKLWCSQLSYEDKTITILVANCGIEEDEYCLLVALDNVVSYGCYLSYDNLEAIIGVFINSHWEAASTFLQANFLAGMEQLRHISGEWVPCKEFSEFKKNIISFIEYCDGQLDERKKD